MVSFQRMKEELDDISTQVTNKLPVISRTSCLIIGAVFLSLFLLIGLAIGYASSSSSTSSSSPSKDSNVMFSFFIQNNSKSCPPLRGDRLLTTVSDGESFEGLVISLSCRGEYNPFPNQVKCRRKSSFDDTLEWSHIPVCYPSVLVSKKYWTRTLHARSVSCTGDSSQTRCQLSCIHDYIPVERQPYSCQSQPCKAWTLGEAQCYMCQKKCAEMHDIHDPNPSSLLSFLNCSPKCSNILVNSDGKAAIWQSKRIGWYSFIGEHNDRPVYQNNATKEFLFYTFDESEWLIGPDYRKPHAGIQIYGSHAGLNNNFCPEMTIGKNMTRLYIDSSSPSVGGTGKWTEDPTLTLSCMSAKDFEVMTCSCNEYKVYNLAYVNGTVPPAVQYLSGNFTRVKDHLSLGLLSPMYTDDIKNLYLFSHHPRGRVWQISTKLSTTPVRGIFNGEGSACPDNEDIKWEWFNTTTLSGQQIYVPDSNIMVKCIN